MKAENQALRLERLVQRHQRYPEYELCLPYVSVKKSALKSLSAGDLLLLGLESMELLLFSENDGCAKAILASCDKSMTIQISESFKKREEPVNSKKYKELKISLGSLYSRTLEAGHKIETTQIDPEEVLLYEKEKLLAKGRLVTVDDEIAVEIKEVKR